VTNARPKVVIVGGGFGGIAAAKGLARAPVEVTIIDRRNHHVFQPLLYQVATASLSPADISMPIRSIVRDQKNCRVVLGAVTGVDPGRRRLLVDGGHLPYDYLVLAAGATHAYFGHDDWAPIAPGIKSVEDAVELRRRILLAFETAEYEADDAARRAALTFAIVGAGPTGVELAGAIKEIAAETLPRDFRNINTRTTRVLLFQADDRVLPGFAPELSEHARKYLERMGVEVHLGKPVTDVSPEGLTVGGRFIAVRNIFWAAGVRASSVGASLGAPTDGAGRVRVGPDLTIPDHPEVFVIGDMASAESDGEPVPGVAQGAIQMGRYAARRIAAEVAGREKPGDRPPFVYKDKGSMAVIGKNRAVAEIGRFRFGGFFAWVLWGVIHIAFLVNFRNRIQVLFSWFWNWFINARDARLITGDARVRLVTPCDDDFVPDPADHAQIHS